MTSIASIAVSGMNAAQTALEVSAGNVANSGTPGYQRREVVNTQASGGGVNASVQFAATGQTATDGGSLITDVVSQLQAKNAFLANLAVFKTTNKMAGALLDKTV